MRRITGSSEDVLAIREAPVARRKWTRLSEEARADVIARYEAGDTSTLLADEFKVAKSTILGILRANNVVVRRRPLESDLVTEAVRLYESGLSLSRVATILAVNQETMRIAILNAGVTLRPPTR